MNYQLHIQENQDKINNDTNSKSIFTFNNNNYENDDIIEDITTENDKNDFKNKRNSHYNEFKIMQAMKLKMKNQMKNDDNVDDDDDDDDDINNDKIIEDER